MENRNSGFKIGLDDVEEDLPPAFVRTARDTLQTRTDVRHLEKINRRLTLLAILLPCLMAVSLYAVYSITVRRIEQSEQSRTQTEIQAVSQALEAKFTELSDRYAAIEKNLSEKEDPLKEAFLVFEKTSASLSEKLAEMEKSKADKSAMESRQKEVAARMDEQIKGITDRISELAQNMPPLQESLKNIRDELSVLKEQAAAMRTETENLKTLVNRPNAELTGLTEDLTRLKSEIVEMLSETIDRKSLDGAIAAQHKEYRKEMDFIIKNMNEKDKDIRALQREVKNLESRVKSLSAKPLGTPKPGRILEQDLQ